MRIGSSPLWEVAGSIALLARGSNPPWPYQNWYFTARRRMGQGSRAQLLAWVIELSGSLPDALTPIPPSAEPTLEEELDALPAKPLDGIAVPFPRGGLAWFTDAVNDYWQSVMRPYWPTMRSVLQEDLLRRAHVLATKGAEEVAAHLDDRCAWQAGTFAIPVGAPTDTVRCSRQLVVVAILFGRGQRLVRADDGLVALSCQASGAIVLAKDPIALTATAKETPQLNDRLAIVVGRARAAVLRALVVPSTTSTLAGSLGLAPSTVSEHLTALVSAGVVQRRRFGSKVLYGLDRAGQAMLGQFDINR